MTARPRGSIVINEPGIYWCESDTSEKLTVDRVAEEEGANITVLINSVPSKTQPAAVE